MSESLQTLATGYRIGDRVQLHPATDAWMMGDKFGDVIGVRRFCLEVHMDRSGRVRRVLPENLEVIS